MLDRAWRIALGVGLTAGILTVFVATFGGSHIEWTGGTTGTTLHIQIGGDDSGFPGFMAKLSITAIVVGVALMALIRRQELPADRRQASFSLLDFLQAVRKSNSDCQLTGVCGGMGAHSPIPAWVWRALFLLLVLYYGVGLGVYIILAICMPRETVAEPLGQSTAMSQPH